MRRRLAFTAAAFFLSPLAAALQLDRELHGPDARASAVPAAPAAASTLALRLSDAISPAAGLRRYSRSSQPLIVVLTVNADAKGERVVRMDEAGGFLLKREDLEEIGQARNAPAYEIDGEAFIELRALPRARAKFDEKNLALEVTFPPEDLPGQHFDLTTRLTEVDITAPPRSALLNYRLGYAGTSGSGGGTVSLAAEAAVAYGGWLVRNQSFHSRSPEDSSSIRLETQAIHDDRDNLRRLTLGDSVTPGLSLGSSVPFGGITFAKAYALSPYLVRQPSVGYRGLAEFPSQVDFYVGNTLVLRQRVGPGPFDIQNFTYFGGQRDVRVVVRDVFGREQTISYPFYFANQGLAAGLHDYSYQAGWLRRGSGLEGNDYGPFAFSAFHQYGFSDAWTLGVRTEGTSRMANAGGDVFYRSEWLGLWGLHGAASRDRDSGRDGHAFAFAHTFQRGEVSTQLIWQGFSPDYAILSAGPAPRLPRRDFSVNAAYAAPWLGSIGVGFTRLELPGDAPTRSWNATYSRPLLDRITFNAILRQQVSEPRGTEIFLGLQYIPRPDQAASVSWNRDLHGARTVSAYWANQVPHGEGVAYSLGAQRQQLDTGSTTVLTPRVEWYSRAGILGAEVTRVAGGGSGDATGYSLSLAGALVSAEGRFDLSRPISDSFAIVELDPPMAGVLVYENSQPAGRSDSRGRVLLPNIPSYANNYASLRDKDVPIDYTIDKVGRSFSPPYRSGTLVPFRIERLKIFTGRLVYRAGAKVLPLEYQLAEIDAGGRKIEMPTGKNGEFYVENPPPGRQRASVLLKGSRCDFTVDIPASEEAQVTLGDIMTCHAAP